MLSNAVINISAPMQQPVQRTEDAHGCEAERCGAQEIQRFPAGVAKHAGPPEEQERGRELYPFGQNQYIFFISNAIIWTVNWSKDNDIVKILKEQFKASRLSLLSVLMQS